jgi:hypothetical protein
MSEDFSLPLLDLMYLSTTRARPQLTVPQSQPSTAGFCIKQMTLGVPSYGHSFRVTPAYALDSLNNIILYAPFNKSAQLSGDKWDSTVGGVDECGNAASGINYTFENCSVTAEKNYLESLLMMVL